MGHWYFTHASIPFKITGSDIFDNNSRLVLTSAMKNAHVEEFNLLLEQPGQLFNPGLVKDQYASELINETANVDTMDIFFQIKPHDIFHRDEFIEGLNNYLQFKLKDIPIIGNELFVPYAKDWCNNCIINTQLELKPIIQNGAVKVISKCCKFK